MGGSWIKQSMFQLCHCPASSWFLFWCLSGIQALSLFWLTSNCLMHLGLWHLLSRLAGFHPSALSVCSKLRLSVSCVTSSPQLRGFSPPPRKHWHISPLKLNLASTSCYLSSYKHPCVACPSTAVENRVILFMFSSPVCTAGEGTSHVLKGARQPRGLLYELCFGSVPLI